MRDKLLDGFLFSDGLRPLEFLRVTSAGASLLLLMSVARSTLDVGVVDFSLLAIEAKFIFEESLLECSDLFG